MKKAFLLIVLPALLVALGFAQTPTPTGNTDPTNIQGCLGGSDGNYTVAEDNTGQTFRITTSSVDLKPHLGHEVKLMGNKTTGAAGSGTADNSLAVTEVSMISEHCAPAVAAAAATVSTTPETVITPSAPAAVPANAPVNAPAETAATPAAVATPPAETAVAPAAATPPAVTPPADTVVVPAPVIAPPAETVVTPAPVAAPPAETVVTPAPVAAAQPTPSARPRKRSATPAAAAPAEPVSTPVAAAAPTPAPVSTTSDAASTPAPAAATPTVTHKGGSLWLIPAVVLLLILGIMVPLVSKWRKQKLLDQTSGENLSLTQEAIPVVVDKSEDKTDVRKAA